MSEPLALAGKRIVVTGASRGIGRAIARAAARAGARVGVGYLHGEAEAKALAAEDPDRYVPLRLDVRDGASIEAAVARFREAARGIDGWVNNAAVNHAELLVAATPERIREQVDVNLLGPILCARAVLPVMLEQRAGVIVNLGSVSAARATRGQAVYAATKGALESLTRALAVEYGRKGVRCHCIRPGPIATGMLETARALAGDDPITAGVPLRRTGRPEEVADLAVYLLGDSSAFVTGSVHTIDGGYLA